MSDKVLVTGADGFIGSHLVEELVLSGKKVKAMVFYNSFNSFGWLESIDPNIKNQLEIVSGDVRDPYFVKRAVSECEYIYHLAALIAIPYSYHSPHSYIDTNITGTLNLLQAARENGISKFVHTSTSEVYGTAQFVPITEEHRLNGQSPYSASKIGADQMAYSFYCSFNLPVAIIRPFNTYGPRQSARAIIPTIITQLLSGSSEIKLGSLTPTRDLNYIKDTVSGFISVMESSKSVGEVINIGSGFDISIGDLAEILIELTGSSTQVVEDVNRIRPEKSEVGRLLASTDKAKKYLNWQSAYGGIDGLRRGLKETIEWFGYKDNLRQYKFDLYNV